MSKTNFEQTESAQSDCGELSPFHQEIPWIASTKGIEFPTLQARPEAAPAADPSIKKDGRGRFESITYASGKIRNFSYTGNEDQPSSVVSYDPATRLWKTFVKNGAESWANVDAQGKTLSTWLGEVRLRPDGTYATREANDRSLWTVYHPDGSSGKEKRTEDGALAVFDINDRLVHVKRNDGKVMSVTYDSAGLLQSVTETNGKTKKRWKRDENANSWHLDGAPDQPARHNVRLNEDGAYLFLDANGNECKEREDGHVEVTISPVSVLEKDETGKLIALSNRNGDRRVFSDETQYKEVSLSESGELTFRNDDGIKIIERNDFIAVTCDKEDRPHRLKMPDGSQRIFDYDVEGQLQKITDNVKTSDGTVARQWVRDADSSRFVSVNPDGTQSERLNIQVQANGDYLYTLKDGIQRSNRAVELIGQHTMPTVFLENTRGALRTRARESGCDLSKIEEYVAALEKRAREAKESGLKYPSEEQIAKTFQHVAEMLVETDKDGNFSRSQRAVLAKLALHNIAYPRRIDQGANDTCNITTVEIYTASRNPDVYARLIKEITLAEKFTTSSGKQIRPPKEGFAPGPEECAFRVDSFQFNQRNWASQLFQVTGINTIIPFLPQSNDAPAWGKPYIGGNPSMPFQQILDACKEINGQKMPYFSDRHAPRAEELLKLRQDGDLPVGIFTIHATDNTGFHGLHVQTIHDVRKKGATVEVLLDDQRGEAHDGWVSLQRLYEKQQLRPPQTPVPQ